MGKRRICRIHRAGRMYVQVGSYYRYHIEKIVGNVPCYEYNAMGQAVCIAKIGTSFFRLRYYEPLNNGVRQGTSGNIINAGRCGITIRDDFTYAIDGCFLNRMGTFDTWM